VDSELGRGSTFHFTAVLQILSGPAPVLPQDEDLRNMLRSVGEEPQARKLKVLLAEDNLVNQKVRRASWSGAATK